MLDDCLKSRGNCQKCDRHSMCFPKSETKIGGELAEGVVSYKEWKVEPMPVEEAIEFGKMWLDINSDSKNTNSYQFTKTAVTALEAQISAIEELNNVKAEMERELKETPFNERDYAVDRHLERYVQILSDRIGELEKNNNENLC